MFPFVVEAGHTAFLYFSPSPALERGRVIA